MRSLFTKQRLHLGLGPVFGPDLVPTLLDLAAVALEFVLRPGRRHRGPRCHQIAPFERGGVGVDGGVDFPRLGRFQRDLIGHRRRVVLVGETGEVMPELVDEDVVGKLMIGRDGAVEVEDAAAAVGLAVDHDLDDVVGSPRCQVAERPILEGQHVALRAEGVVGGADRRAPVNAVRRPGDARCGGRRTQAPDVEVVAPLGERRLGEERLGETLGVGDELAALGGGVAVAQEQQVDLGRRIAVVLDGDASRVGHRGRVDEHVARVDGEGPDVDERVGGVAFLERHLDRRFRSREAQRLVEGAVHLLGLARGLPLAIDRGEATRIEQRATTPGRAPRIDTCPGWCRRSVDEDFPAKAAVRSRRGRG